MSTEDDSREQGIEFGSLTDELESEQYPLEKEDVLEKYGSHQISLEDETQTVEEILGPLGEATYESADEVRQEVIGAVGGEAVGRKNYSDRGDALNEEEREQESI